MVHLYEPLFICSLQLDYTAEAHTFIYVSQYLLDPDNCLNSFKKNTLLFIYCKYMES